MLPTIYLNKTLPIGFSVLGATHAAMAWNLRTAEEKTAFNKSESYQPKNFVWLDTNAFQDKAQEQPSNLISESTLHGKGIAIAKGPKQQDELIVKGLYLDLLTKNEHTHIIALGYANSLKGPAHHEQETSH